MTFGQQNDEATAIRMVDMALDAGVNFMRAGEYHCRCQNRQMLQLYLSACGMRS